MLWYRGLLRGEREREPKGKPSDVRALATSIGFLLVLLVVVSSWFCFYTSFLIMTKKVLFCVFVERTFWRMNMSRYLTETATVILLFNSKLFTAKVNFSSLWLTADWSISYFRTRTAAAVCAQKGVSLKSLWFLLLTYCSFCVEFLFCFLNSRYIFFMYSCHSINACKMLRREKKNKKK